MLGEISRNNISLRKKGQKDQAAGADLINVIKTTVFLTDMNDFAVVNEIYSSFFKGNTPARSAVQVVGLPKGAAIEIEVIAYLC